MTIQLGYVKRPICLKIVAGLEVLWGVFVVPYWLVRLMETMNEGADGVSVLAYLFEIVIGIAFFLAAFGLWTYNPKLFRVAKILAIFEIIRGILAFLAGLLPLIDITRRNIHVFTPPRSSGIICPMACLNLIIL